MNSDDLTPSPLLTPTLKPTDLVPLESPKSFDAVPLENLLDMRVEQMSPTELAAYIQKCSLLRSSSQTRKAALRAEGGAGPKKATRKSSVERAMELLAQLKSQSHA